MPYPEHMVAPMRAEVVNMGVTQLMSASEVEDTMKETSGTALYFINSVCGCAAGSARPGLGMSLQSDVKPDRLYTAFAGMEGDAVNAIRERLVGYPPSSPCIALFKDGDLAAVVERHEIQGMQAEQLGTKLAGMYAELS